MPVGLALMAADKISTITDEGIILALPYRSFPSEALYCLFKVSTSTSGMIFDIEFKSSFTYLFSLRREYVLACNQLYSNIQTAVRFAMEITMYISSCLRAILCWLFLLAGPFQNGPTGLQTTRSSAKEPFSPYTMSWVHFAKAGTSRKPLLRKGRPSHQFYPQEYLG
jgi:coenzyme PQQ precursor peptide PqqA